MKQNTVIALWYDRDSHKWKVVAGFGTTIYEAYERDENDEAGIRQIADDLARKYGVRVQNHMTVPA